MLAILLVSLFLVLLIISGEVFIRGIIQISSRLNLSSFAIGATVVALGTASPDFFFSTISSYKGHFDVSVGSLIGSITTNILLCIGIASLISTIKFNNKDSALKFNMRYHIIFFIIFACFATISKGKIGFWFALMLFLNGIVFIILNIKYCTLEEDEPESGTSIKLSVAILMSILGIIGLYTSSHFVLQYLIEASEFFSIPKKVISSTIISFGTSIPEITTAILASIKKRSKIIIGNVIGSNILIFSSILGFSGLISNVLKGTEIKLILPFLTLDLPFLFTTLVIFFILFTVKEQFGRIVGLIFIFLYLLYILLQIYIV